jgi:hypothetical protein
MLEREGHITVPSEFTRAKATVIRAIRRFIKVLGLKRGKNKGVQNYQLKLANQRLRCRVLHCVDTALHYTVTLFCDYILSLQTASLVITAPAPLHPARLVCFIYW